MKQLLLWLHDPSGRKDAAVSFWEKKRIVNTAPEIHYKPYIIVHYSSHYATISLALL